MLLAAATRLAQNSLPVPADKPAEALKKKKTPLPQHAVEPPTTKAPAAYHAGDTESPPRFSGDETANVAASGLGNRLSDDELVAMLRLPPKSVPHLRTKSQFSQYFASMKVGRFDAILQRAYQDIADEGERAAKVAKRLSLVRDVLAE